MADNRKYYVICANNCKFEGMTKEQILTAIEQAASTGAIQDVDTGFVTKIREQNRNSALSFWVGTSAEYNAIEKKADDCFYILTDDTTGADIAAALEEMQKTIEAYTAAIPPRPQIIVTARGGVITCTDARGNKVDPTSAVNNVWTFTVSNYGTYTVKGVFGKLEQIKTVDVSSVAQYPITLEYYSSTFSDNDWATIIDFCQRGICPDEWKAGDTKAAVKDVFDYPVVIIGKNHDKYKDGTTAPFTFKISGKGSDNYQPIDGKRMNNTQSNAGGWETSEMRASTIPQFIAEKLSDTVANALREVKKLTSAGNKSTNLVTTYDKLFLCSEVERFGTVEYSVAGEGKQYEYYSNGNGDGVGKSGNSEALWLRSPSIKDTTSFCYIYKSSSVEKVSTSAATQTMTIDALPAFCF